MELRLRSHKKELEVVDMVWETTTYKVLYNGEVILEKAEPLTAADVKAAAVQAGIRGKFDVFCAEDGQELLPGDFPVEQDVIIKPRFTAA